MHLFPLYCMRKSKEITAFRGLGLHIYKFKYICNMRTKLFFIFITIVLVSCNGIKNETASQLEKTPAKPGKTSRLDTSAKLQIQYNLARNDLMSGNGKYYHIGIRNASSTFIDSMKNNYNLEVISLGCNGDELKTAYNVIMDSFISNVKTKR